MNNLLNFEFKKLFSSKAFYVCLILGVVFSSLTILVELSILKLINGNEAVSSSNLGLFLSNYEILESFINFVIMIFVSIFITEDYKFGTIKGIRSRGYSGANIYLSKIISSAVGCIIIYIASMLANFVWILTINKTDESTGLEYAKISMCCLSMLINIVIAIFFATLFRKLSLSILGILLIPNIFATFLTLVWAGLLAISNLEVKSTLSSYPFYNYFYTNFTSLFLDATSSFNFGLYITLSLLYIVLPLIGGYFINRKREIKI